MKVSPFTAAQYDLLLALRAEGKSWTEIGKVVGHGANSCSSTYSVRSRKQGTGQNKNTNPWTKDQLALLERMSSEGKSWDECAAAVGHSSGSCKTVLHAKRRKDGVEWTGTDIARLRQMRDIEQMKFRDIGHKLGRSKGSCRAKYWALQETPVIHGQPEPGMRVTVTPEQLADRDARYRLTMQQSPAAALMGEPLLGRSALDMRRQGGAL